MHYYTQNYNNVMDFERSCMVAEEANPPFYYDVSNGIKLYNADTFSFFKNIPDGCVDLIFADPPYFLSSGGITCHSGKMENVNKGEWDKSKPIEEIHNYNKQWLSECNRILKKHATIWVCGTFHNIFSVGFALQELDFKILNNIVWEKKDPPPNLTKKYFVHASEHLLWASKTKYSKHIFHQDALKEVSNGEPMKSVWRDIWKLPSVDHLEKVFGKHPTQKPEEVIRRAVLASSNIGSLVFDPFCGSGTTGVVCRRMNRRFVGVDNNLKYLDIAKKRIASVK